MTFPLKAALLDYHCAMAEAMRRQSSLEVGEDNAGGTPHVQYPSPLSGTETVHGNIQEEPMLYSEPEPQFEEVKPDCQHSWGSIRQHENSIVYQLQEFTQDQGYWLLEKTRGEPYDEIDWLNCAQEFLRRFQQPRDGRELNLEYLRLGSLKIEEERRRLLQELHDDFVGTVTDFSFGLGGAEIGEEGSIGEGVTCLGLHGMVDGTPIFDVAPIVGDPEVFDGLYLSGASGGEIPDLGPMGYGAPNDSSEQIRNPVEELPLDGYDLCGAVDEVTKEPGESTEKASSKRKRSLESTQFPRIVRTKTISDTSVAMMTMENAAPLNLQPPPEILPQFEHNKSTRSLIQFLSALLSQPSDREVRIVCNSRSTIAYLTAEAENTEKRVWLSPSPHFKRTHIGPNGELEIQDLIHEILLMVDTRIRVFGCRTWLQYDEEDETDTKA